MFEKTAQIDLIEAAMSNLPTGAFICDAEGIVRFVNKAYANYLHLQPEQMVGRHITELIPDSGIPAVLRSGKAELRQVRRFANDNALLIVNRVPLFDAAGTLIGALSMTLFDTADQVKTLLEHVQQLDSKVSNSQRQIRTALSSQYTVDSIVGVSQPIREVKRLLLRYAAHDAAVLVLGATGTGKELVAGAIHAASPRSDGPFVSVNCATIPKDLFESEIFGYTAGSFTGANREGAVGKLEMANRGTLFLDEIGDLPLPAQAKLLRVLEEKRFYRVGSTRPIEVDFRLVTATNRDLVAMINAGTFREDLYYRINSLKLQLPLLKDRREDIPVLVRHFLDRMGAAATLCGDAALDLLLSYAWPGNVRELRHALGHALCMCHDGVIAPQDLPAECSLSGLADLPEGTGLQAISRSVEDLAIEKALRETGGNKSKAASLLGISRTALYAKLHRQRTS